VNSRARKWAFCATVPGLVGRWSGHAEVRSGLEERRSASDQRASELLPPESTPCHSLCRTHQQCSLTAKPADNLLQRRSGYSECKSEARIPRVRLPWTRQNVNPTAGSRAPKSKWHSIMRLDRHQIAPQMSRACLFCRKRLAPWLIAPRGGIFNWTRERLINLHEVMKRVCSLCHRE
jgi:hypothetical protein